MKTRIVIEAAREKEPSTSMILQEYRTATTIGVSVWFGIKRVFVSERISSETIKLGCKYYFDGRVTLREHE